MACLTVPVDSANKSGAKKNRPTIVRMVGLFCLPRRAFYTGFIYFYDLSKLLGTSDSGFCHVNEFFTNALFPLVIDRTGDFGELSSLRGCQLRNANA